MAVPKTQGYFLDMLERSVPDEYINGLKDPGDGYEIVEALAEVGKRISEAVAHYKSGIYAFSASGGAKATATVCFHRASIATLNIVALPGTIVQSKFGRQYKTLENANFTTNLVTNSVTVEALSQGFIDEPGPVTTADGTELAGVIDTIVFPNFDPPYGDTTVTVEQLTTTSGGRFPYLDFIGVQRGVFRAPSESDEVYRARILSLSKVVTPSAMKELAAAVLNVYKQTILTYVEQWSPDYTGVWDVPNVIVGESTDPTLFVYDDPRENDPIHGRWVDELDCPGAFIVQLPKIPAIREMGLVYDDPAVDPSELISPDSIGSRALSVYDMPVELMSDLACAVYDGSDMEKRALHKGLFTSLQQQKAAGYAAMVVTEGDCANV